MTGPLWLWWQQGDAVARGTALLLLALSVASWVVIVWKIWFMAASRRRVPQAIAAFWSAPDLATGQDRKSTRLNSSHSQISYAVFCLKKKNPSMTYLLPSIRAYVLMEAASAPLEGS